MTDVRSATSLSNQFGVPTGDASQFHAQVLAAIHDSVIVTTLEGRIIYWNGGAELFGYTAEEILGQTPAILYPSGTPDTLTLDLGRIMTGQPYIGRWEGRREDGSVVWVDVTTTVVQDGAGTVTGFLGVAKDATDRQRAEDALVQSERRYRQVSQVSREALWEWDLASDTVEWSAGAETILSYAPGTISPNGALWPEQIHADDRERTLAGFNAALVGAASSWSDEYRVRRRDGTYAIVSDRAYIERDADGRAVRAVGALADITGRRQAEEQYRKADRLEAVGRLAGGIAHDLNNRLQSILGWSEFLARRFVRGSPDATEVDLIRQAAQRSVALVRQLLAFARRDVVLPQRLDLNAVVTNAIALLRPLLRADIRLELRLDPKLGPVYADKSRIEQSRSESRPERPGCHAEGRSANGRNDVCHTGQRVHRTPRAHRCPARSLRAARDRRYWAWNEPRDSGPDLRAVLHDETRGKGTGLGLATVYGTVKQAGGLVWAYSEVGIGTVFKMYLPEA